MPREYKLRFREVDVTIAWFSQPLNTVRYGVSAVDGTDPIDQPETPTQSHAGLRHVNCFHLWALSVQKGGCDWWNLDVEKRLPARWWWAVLPKICGSLRALGGIWAPDLSTVFPDGVELDGDKQGKVRAVTERETAAEYTCQSCFREINKVVYWILLVVRVATGFHTVTVLNFQDSQTKSDSRYIG